MNDLVYPRERTLGLITLCLGVLAWLALIAGTFGGALVVLLLGFLIYLFTQSALISHIKGNGVELNAQQFPDLHAQFVGCCQRLQISTLPQAFVLSGGGVLNAFATRFLGRQYVVLLSDVVDAMQEHPDGVRFYFGHELGHLKMKHLVGQLFRWPVLWLPLLGAAYSRAREITCDLHGAACCQTGEGAARAVAALAAGGHRWKQVNLAAYKDQAFQSSGFWMSFHEIISGYSWVAKRALRVSDPQAQPPDRSKLAYVFAAVVPYAGRLGGGFGLLILVYIVAVLAAVAVPAYQDYVVKAKVAEAVVLSEPARNALAKHYTTHEQVPDSLQDAGIAPQLPNGITLELQPDDMVLIVKLPQGDIVFSPSKDKANQITWACEGGTGLKPSLLPPSCRRD